ncbi:hypothetical protein NX059_011290 [Plenodomus lindquistii]|nr:hypothetical protein NX059_011290 [Plenodomus lindquistii]
MGTHISKVKSVDLDTWTDEQLQSVLKWGNARANKYWEAKLAPGHVPSEAKIENFIRTKYESKRWTMEGPMPDPSTLEADDDDLQPLSKVQEKVQVERSASQRLTGSSARAPPPQPKPQPAIDLFGDEPAPARPSTGPPAATRAPPRQESAPPKQTKAGDSLLGLDFLGGTPSSQPARPSSTGPATTAAPSRPDLKQSILSLYASKPAAAPQPQQHARQDSFGGLTSPQAQTSPQQSSFGGMNDAFSSLSFSAAPAPKPSPFSGLDNFSSAKSPPTTSSSNMFGGGGNFFASKPQSPPAQQSQIRTISPAGGLGNFDAFTSSAPQSKPAAPAASGMNDLLDLSMPSAPAPAPRMTSPPITSPATNSAFNLTSPSAPSAAPKAAPAPAAVNYGGGFSNMDAWGGNDVWASNAPSQPSAPAATATHTAPKSPGWGAPAQVTQDDDFGGWSSAAPTTQSNAPAQKPAGGFGGASDDLFSNVWE